MSGIISRTRWRGLIVIACTLSLLAAACGGSATESAPVVAASETANTQSTADTEAVDGNSGDADGEAASVAGDPEPVTNLFLDIEVVRVDDATTLNLATELGGGSLPVLLWFWAPH